MATSEATYTTDTPYRGKESIQKINIIAGSALFHRGYLRYWAAENNISLIIDGLRYHRAPSRATYNIS